MPQVMELFVNGQSVCRADFNETRAANVHISTDPHSDRSGLWPLYYWVNGFQWGTDAYSLEWLKGPIEPGQTIEVRIHESQDPATPAQETLVVNTRPCNFCDRPASDVPFMVEKGPFSRICSDCVKECSQLINAKSTPI